MGGDVNEIASYKPIPLAQRKGSTLEGPHSLHRVNQVDRWMYRMAMRMPILGGPCRRMPRPAPMAAEWLLPAIHAVLIGAGFCSKNDDGRTPSHQAPTLSASTHNSIPGKRLAHPLRLGNLHNHHRPIS